MLEVIAVKNVVYEFVTHMDWLFINLLHELKILFMLEVIAVKNVVSEFVTIWIGCL
jgi:hypothetical protein